MHLILALRGILVFLSVLTAWNSVTYCGFHGTVRQWYWIEYCSFVTLRVTLSLNTMTSKACSDNQLLRFAHRLGRHIIWTMNVFTARLKQCYIIKTKLKTCFFNIWIAYKFVFTFAVWILMCIILALNLHCVHLIQLWIQSKKRYSDGCLSVQSCGDSCWLMTFLFRYLNVKLLLWAPLRHDLVTLSIKPIQLTHFCQQFYNICTVIAMITWR